MKSNKQRRAEIKARRLEQVAKAAAQVRVQDARPLWGHVPVLGMELADTTVLARYNNTYAELPGFYMAREFTCRDCGSEELWTAKQQKWWYEEMHGPIDSRAVRCLACRRARRACLRRAGPGANLLREQTERLRALAAAKPNAKTLAEIDAALQSKWWSLRVVAIQTMGRWGGEACTEKLKALVTDCQGGGHRGFGWAYVAADAARSALTCRE